MLSPDSIRSSESVIEEHDTASVFIQEHRADDGEANSLRRSSHRRLR